MEQLDIKDFAWQPNFDKEVKPDITSLIVKEEHANIDDTNVYDSIDIQLESDVYTNAIKKECLYVKPELYDLLDSYEEQNENIQQIMPVKSELTEEVVVKDEICTFENNISLISNHPLQVFQTGNTLICDICKYKAQDSNKLKAHIRTHTGEKPYGCTECSFRTNWKHALRQHVTSHTGEKPLKCQFCNYDTSTKHRMQMHMLTHSNFKSFKCEVCSYETARKGHFQRHMKTHTGEKPFECYKCSFKTARKSHLQRHIMIHTGEKPFKCIQCGFRTSQKDRLKQHIMKVHCDKRLKCNQCKYKTSVKSNLKVHIMRVHNKGKPVENLEKLITVKEEIINDA